MTGPSFTKGTTARMLAVKELLNRRTAFLAKRSRAHATAFSGRAPSSQVISSILRPAMPPALLVSSAHILVAWLRRIPTVAAGPESGAISPTIHTLVDCAEAAHGSNAIPNAAPIKRNAPDFIIAFLP